MGSGRRASSEVAAEPTPAGASAPSDCTNDALVTKVVENLPDERIACDRGGTADVSDRELVADRGSDELLDRLCLGAASSDRFGVRFEPVVRCDEDPDDVAEPVQDVVLLLVPADGRGSERVVIGFLRVGDEFLETGVTADLIALSVEEQQHEQSGHSSVAVRERMDNGEVEHV